MSQNLNFRRWGGDRGQQAPPLATCGHLISSASVLDSYSLPAIVYPLRYSDLRSSSLQSGCPTNITKARHTDVDLTSCLLLACLMGQYFARWRLLSVVVVCLHLLSLSSVTLPAGGMAGRQAMGRSTAAGLGAWAVGRLTLHGGPVVLRPIRATPCFS